MSLHYLLDTNVVSALARRTPPAGLVERIAAHEGELAIASLVWHELRYGPSLLPPSRRRDTLERFVTDVVASTFAVLDYDRRAAEWHAAERARLVRAGRTPPFVDGQIAAVAVVNGLVLVTGNTADFEHFSGPALENWLATADDLPAR